MTEEELLASSQLVVDAHATSAVCKGAPVEDEVKITSTYLSSIEVTATVKGTPPEVLTVRGNVEDYKVQANCAAALPPVPEGFRGRLYLIADADGTYVATNYDGFIEDSATSAPEPLPDCSAGGSAGAAGNAGASGAAGSSGDGGTGANPAEPEASSDSGGCGISTSTTPASGGFALLGLAVAAALTRRRRR